MRRLDRYILRQFIQTAVFAVLAFVLIFIVVDMMENLDDFLDHNGTPMIIATYYFYFIPEIVKLIVPVAMLMSALFTTGRMSTYNELTAMKSSGMSLYRYMAPLLIFSLFLSGAMIYFNGWVVPSANKRKFDIGRVYFQKNVDYTTKSNIHFEASHSRIVTLGSFDENRGAAFNVSIEDFSPQDPTRILHRIDAAELQWQDTSGTWLLSAGVERTFEGDHEHMSTFAEMPIGKLNFSPDDVKKKQQKPDEMDYPGLKAFILNQEQTGHDTARWTVDLDSKIAFPFASFIVVLFGVPFSSIKRRGGLGVEFGISLAVCFLYMIFLKVSEAFGYNGDLNPLLTAWLANIIFFTAGIYNMIRVPK
jgi:lipopolysaccharide export system permease protein